MASAIRRGYLPVEGGAPALERDAMIALMEEWVRTLNRKGGPLLRKAVVCIDCHQRDPRGRESVFRPGLPHTDNGTAPRRG